MEFKIIFRPAHALLACAVFALAAALPATAAAPAVKAANAWVRAPAPGQKNANAYVELTSAVDAALVAADSPAASRVELHSMSVEGGVMRMRALPRIALPAGKTVKLVPGGLHLMLIELKRPLKAGDKVPLTLSVQEAGASPTTLRIEADVRAGGGAHAH